MASLTEITSYSYRSCCRSLMATYTTGYNSLSIWCVN